MRSGLFTTYILCGNNLAPGDEVTMLSETIKQFLERAQRV